VISETFFCSHYSSIWRSLTPSLEDCVRRYNLTEYDRIWPPLPSISDPARRGLINEASFVFFCENYGKARADISRDLDNLLAEAFSKSASFLQLELGKIEGLEKREVVAMAGRLETFFATSSWSGQGNLQISPDFRGCGILGSCRGDVIKGKTLFEVKAGERKFRSIDFRQLLVYMALRYAENRSVFERMGIVNPRTGISIAVDTELFCRDAAGLDPYELFERVLSALSANLVSD